MSRTLCGFAALGLGAFVLATAASSAGAAATIGSLDTTGFINTGGQDRLAQSFVVPAGETGLVSGTIVLQNSRPAASTGVMSIWPFAVNGFNGDFGPALASVPITLPVGTQQAITSTFNLTVVPGQTYALGVDWGVGNGGTSGGSYSSNGMNTYPDGLAVFGPNPNGDYPVFTSLDLPFQVNFGAIPEPAGAAVAGVALAGTLLRRGRGRQ